MNTSLVQSFDGDGAALKDNEIVRRKTYKAPYMCMLMSDKNV